MLRKIWIVLGAIVLLSIAPVWAVDSDGDGIEDAVDNCPTVPNPDQADSDQSAGEFGPRSYFPGAAPTVRSIFPADLDGDGDMDLAVSGDGDRQVFWLEQVSPGSFELNQLPGGAGWGQAGATAGDLNRDGIAEMAFASFDKNQVGIWQS